MLATGGREWRASKSSVSSRKRSAYPQGHWRIPGPIEQMRVSGIYH